MWCLYKIYNMKRFNGTFGCTYCEHPTERIGKVIKYPMQENVHHCALIKQ